MQSVASVTSAPSLPVLFKRALKEGGMSPQAEERLTKQLDRIEEKLNGNGTPGLFTRMRVAEDELQEMRESRKQREIEIAAEKKQAADDKKNSWWRRLAFQAATVGVALILGALWTNYVNKAPTPVDKTLGAAEEKIKAEAEAERIKNQERMDKIEKALTQIANPPRPSRYTSPKKPDPIRVNKLIPDGTMVVDGPTRVYSSARIVSGDKGQTN